MAKRADPSRLSDRAKRNAQLRPEVECVFDANFRVYGVRKVRRQMRREGIRCRSLHGARKMKQKGIEGILRDKKVRTTGPDKAAPCRLDRVNRQFRLPAPDMCRSQDLI